MVIESFNILIKFVRRNEKIKDIAELHKIILNIAKSFHKICSDNNIPYYMIAGTMLGAIRHKGFIHGMTIWTLAFRASILEKQLKHCEISFLQNTR